MQRTVVGGMGAGEGATAILLPCGKQATERLRHDQQQSYELGIRIAQQGWLLLAGGRNLGVMAAASRGAKAANGTTIGILPAKDGFSVVDIAIFTNMGNARNSINVLSSDVIIACGMGAGTASEVALALKEGKPVILLNPSQESWAFFRSLSAEVSMHLPRLRHRPFPRSRNPDCPTAPQQRAFQRLTRSLNLSFCFRLPQPFSNQPLGCFSLGTVFYFR